ncbi:MAG: hypothetical protein M5U26_08290 [Planctomycetota bacterium]|nr:hypothetical protein [Planctomycetota bacterium]
MDIVPRQMDLWRWLEARKQWLLEHMEDKPSRAEMIAEIEGLQRTCEWTARHVKEAFAKRASKGA